jgi:hypothetical protein
MTSEEELCRWAYIRAMRVNSVRQALNTFGRAIYLGENAQGRPSPFQRFVLSRVDMHVAGRVIRSIIYCNGIAVA